MVKPKELSIIKNVSLAFEEVIVFEDLTLQIPESGITCIVGPSGCGKTSLLNIIAGLLEADSGDVFINNHQTGYVFQEDRLLPWETVYNNIRLVGKVADEDEIMGILEALELADFRNKYPDQLSGGMRQRCAIARGFYFHSNLLLMDEPFKSLDYDLRLNLLGYLTALWQRHKQTIVFVTHDIDEALLIGHRVLVLSDRPAKVLGTYDIETPLNERNVLDEEHSGIRSQIIQHMRR